MAPLGTMHQILRLSDLLSVKRIFSILSILPFVALSVLTAEDMENRLNLTQEECDWLIKNPVIRVGVDEGYPPANFWDESGQLQGIDADFLSAISEFTGVKFELVKMESWAATVEAVKNLELDLLTCITSTPERAEFLAFTQVYLDFPIAIITRNEGEFYSTSSAMRGKKIAVPEGFVTDKVMRQIGWDVEVMSVPTITDAYLAVATGRCYATVGNLGNASYLIPRLGISNLKISGVMPEFTRSRFAVRKDWAILRGIIDKYFTSLSEVERNAMIEKWVRLEVPAPFDWGPVVRIGLAFVLLSSALLWFVLWRYRQLRSQLKERKQHQTAMEDAHERATRLSEEKSDLLHMVAHDLRGPLMAFQTGVGLVNQRIADHPQDLELSTVLSRMDRETEAMQGLIDGLLDVEAIENGSRRFGGNAVNFRACIEQVIERFQPHAQRKDIKIEWSAPVGVLKVKGDVVAIRQVVENLVSNAVKYSPIGGQVAIRLMENEDQIRFEVRDNGPGIAPDEFSLLFTKFGRLSARPTDGESSHGLGLYIVKALVTAMNGEVSCESQLGRGATFLVSLARAS